MTDLQSLIARVEAITLPGDDPEERKRHHSRLVTLDCDIHALLIAKIPKGFVRGSSSGGYIMAHNGRSGVVWSDPCPPVTASIDAAVALCERVLPGWVIDLSIDEGAVAHVSTPTAPNWDAVKSFRAANVTPALALVLATLRALASTAPSSSGGEG